MKRMSVLIALLVTLLASCAPQETPLIPTDTPNPPTQTPTQVLPTDTPTLTPEPTPSVGVYKDNKITFTYPLEWQSAILSNMGSNWIGVASKSDILDDPYNWTYQKGDVGIVISIASLGKQAMGSQIYVLDQYTLFSDMENPDKETAHIVTLGDKEFAIGTYSSSYIKSRDGGAPLFIAVYFSKQSTITIEMYASPDEEAALRKIFEDILASMESIPAVKTSYALQPFEPMLILDVNEISGWAEPSNNQKVYDSGVCRWFEDDKQRTLTTCTMGNSQNTNLAAIREKDSSDHRDSFIDLESTTKHKYDYEIDLYAYQNDDENPVFLLALDNHDLIHTVELKIPPFQAGANFSTNVNELFNNEIDNLLHDVMFKMLEKSKYPFDPDLLIAANGLENWTEPNYGYQFQTAYSDAICRTYDHKTNFDYELGNCVINVRDDYNLNSIKESFQNGGDFTDLQTKSKYTYDYDFIFYGFLRGGYPTYTLYVEKDGLLYNAEFTILEYHDKSESDVILELLNDEIDDTLHEVITKNLEKFQ